MNATTKFRSVIFDFNGVLSNDHFYDNPGCRQLTQNYPGVYEFIQSEIFATDIVNEWMRNQISTRQINQFIAEKTDIDFAILTRILHQSIRSMTLDSGLLAMASKLRMSGVSVGLVTDNMDVFSEILVEMHHLDSVFPFIVNSADYGVLKQDDNGRLFDIAHRQLGDHAYDKFLLVDDSSSARAIFEKKGGYVYPYTTYEKFRVWATTHLIV